jgi:hypothetical protein
MKQKEIMFTDRNNIKENTIDQGKSKESFLSALQSLTKTQKKILNHFIALRSVFKNLFPSPTTIAQAIDSGRTWVLECIKVLESLGFISTTYYHRTSKSYKISPLFANPFYRSLAMAFLPALVSLPIYSIQSDKSQKTDTITNMSYKLKETSHEGINFIANKNSQQREGLHLSPKRKPFSVTMALNVKIGSTKYCKDCNREFFLSRRDDNSLRYGDKCLCKMNDLEKTKYWKTRKAYSAQLEARRQIWWTILRSQNPKNTVKTVVSQQEIKVEPIEDKQKLWLKEKQRIYKEESVFFRLTFLECTFKKFFGYDPTEKDLKE